MIGHGHGHGASSPPVPGDERRVFLGRAEVDSKERSAEVILQEDGAKPGRVELRWENALDEAGLLQGCLSCGCAELFVRKDFPQGLGLGLVIAAAALSVIFFAMGQVAWSVGILAGAVVVDSLIFFFTRKCIVCYRCRTEYRCCEIGETLDAWDLSIGEKYRPVRMNVDAAEAGDESTAID